MKTLTSYNFATTRTSSTHDWTKLLDGQIYQLTSGEDYNCKDVTMASLARLQAKKAGKAIHFQKAEGGVVIQAYVKTEAETPPTRDEVIKNVAEVSETTPDVVETAFGKLDELTPPSKKSRKSRKTAA